MIAAQSHHRCGRASASATPTTPGSAPASPSIVFDEPAVAAIDVRGGGPGTRETALLDPARRSSGIDAIVLSGGSAFGLDAASGVQAWLREQGRGFAVRDVRVPIVPRRDPVRPAQRRRQALGPLPALSRTRLCGGGRAGRDFALGSVGAGLRRHHRQPQGRARLGLGRDARRPHGRRAGRGQCRRQCHGRRRAAFLGGAVRAATANSAAAACRRRFPPRRWSRRQGPRRARTPRSPWSRPTRS